MTITREQLLNGVMREWRMRLLRRRPLPFGLRAGQFGPSDLIERGIAL